MNAVKTTDITITFTYINTCRLLFSVTELLKDENFIDWLYEQWK